MNTDQLKSGENIPKLIQHMKSLGLYSPIVPGPDIEKLLKGSHSNSERVLVGFEQKNVVNSLNGYLTKLRNLNNYLAEPKEVRNDYNSSLMMTIDQAYEATQELKSIAEGFKERLHVESVENDIRDVILRINYASESKFDKDLDDILSKCTAEELHNLTHSISLKCYHSIRQNIKVTTQDKIDGFYRQARLNSVLDKIGFVNGSSTELGYRAVRRLIITTKSVIDLLECMNEYLQKKAIPFSQIESGRLTANIVYDNLLLAGDNQAMLDSSFEIAWGILASLKKHKTEHPYVTTSFDVAEAYIPWVGPNATLVLDGHGNKLNMTIAEKPIYRDDLCNKIKLLLDKDINNHFDHVILQSCMSGTLKKVSDLYVKEAAVSGKKRSILHRDRYTSDDIFEKLKRGPQQMQTLAAAVYESIQESKHCDNIAFTFSENLINPSNRLSEGNIGVRPKQSVSSCSCSVPWPKSLLVSSEATEDNGPTVRSELKSCTILPTVFHRKGGSKLQLFKPLDAFVDLNHNTEVIDQENVIPSNGPRNG